MSKRRRYLWDDEAAFKFSTQSVTPIHEEMDEDMMDMEDLEHEAAYIEEAHEALSKLFTKSNKRGKSMRGVRRKDAWQ